MTNDLTSLVADAKMPKDTNTKPVLDKYLFDELAKGVKGSVYQCGQPQFSESAKVFNGNVKAAALAVVRPLDAEDVSSVIRFCLKHSLSPSVKAGGYGTAGWAVGGDIILDIQRIAGCDIETPGPDGSFTGISDTTSATSKGKQAVGGKRRRDEESELTHYNNASQAVGDFLRGPSAIRRRLDTNGQAVSSDRPVNGTDGSSSNQHGSTNGANPPASSPSNDALQPTPSSIGHPRPGSDPFSYVTTSPTSVAPNDSTSSRVFPSYTWRSDYAPPPNPLLNNMVFPSAHLSVLAPPTPIHSHVYVTFGAGMRQKQIDMFTAEHQIEAKSFSGNDCTIPYHVPFAAHPVGSSTMLLGGFGFLGRLHGLSVDNLVEVEMVLADGSVVIVNENSHPDLWWAVRGAGPALGVATRYKAKAFPVPTVFAGNIIYRFHRATAASLIKHFRDCIKGAPRELYANVLLTAGPEGKDSLVVIQMCYAGSREKGQAYLAAISSWTGDTCLLNEVSEKSFLHQQDSVAQVLRAKAGRQWFIRSALVTSLPDDVIHDTVVQFADTPTGCTWLFELTGGRIPEIEDTCIPREQREAAFTIAALHQWEMGVDDPRCVASADEWIAGTLKPYQTGGPFPSFLGRHEPSERVISCYGEKNFARLREVKKKYDPKNIFRNSLWPLDTDGLLLESANEPPSP